jgi:hypothetical protein
MLQAFYVCSFLSKRDERFSQLNNAFKFLAIGQEIQDGGEWPNQNQHFRPGKLAAYPKQI